MKYLSDYTSEAQTKLFAKHGAFFAFSDKQFEEQSKDGVKYVNLGAGMITPKENAKSLITGLGEINSKGIEDDIAENGVKAIIHRELGNHECQITCDYDEVVDLLIPYGITRKQIADEWQEFWDMCVKNDYF